MVRTQIYLTETEQTALQGLARVSGRKQSELIRDAVDAFIERSSAEYRNSVLERVAGMWKDRKDLPELRELREDRKLNW